MAMPRLSRADPVNEAFPEAPPGFRFLHATRYGTYWFVNADGDYWMVQDTQAILDHNQAMANHNDGWSVDGNGKTDKLMRRAATVPWVVQQMWKEEKGVDYRSPDPDQQAAVNRLLDDIDWSKLRTAHFRIGRHSKWV